MTRCSKEEGLMRFAVDILLKGHMPIRVASNKRASMLRVALHDGYIRDSFYGCPRWMASNDTRFPNDLF